MTSGQNSAVCCSLWQVAKQIQFVAFNDKWPKQCSLLLLMTSGQTIAVFCSQWQVAKPCSLLLSMTNGQNSAACCSKWHVTKTVQFVALNEWWLKQRIWLSIITRPNRWGWMFSYTHISCTRGETSWLVFFNDLWLKLHSRLFLMTSGQNRVVSWFLLQYGWLYSVNSNQESEVGCSYCISK